MPGHTQLSRTGGLTHHEGELPLTPPCHIAPSPRRPRLLRENRRRVVIPEVDEERWEGRPPDPVLDAPCTGCPVYVMLPLDTVWVVERDGRRVSILNKEPALDIALHTLRQAGVEGVMVRRGLGC